MKSLLGISREGEVIQQRDPRKGGCIERKEGGNIKRRGKGLKLEEVEHMLSIHKQNLSKREVHIYSERSRRRKMAHMFSDVISLLPHASPKRDRCMILTELICYIKALQNKIEEMGIKKQELLISNTDYHKRNTNTNHDDVAKVEVNISRANLMIMMKKDKEKEKEKEKEACKRRISWSRILEALHELELEVVTITLSTTFDSNFLFIHAKILNMTTFKNKEEIEVIMLQLFL